VRDRLPSRRSEVRPRTPAPALKRTLDDLYLRYDGGEAVPDPVHLVRRFPAIEDREVVGFCAAALAFGRVQSILTTLGRLVAVMGDAPGRFVRDFEPTRQGPALRSLGHRWVRGDDIVALLLVLRHVVRTSGSIERFVVEGDDPAAPDVGHALETFSTRVRTLDVSEAYGRAPARPGVWFFFPRPSGGSACKRLNLFLRWMVRRDRIDPGGWTTVAPARLIVPLDTHVVRVGRCLGLTWSRTPGWRMACEITAALRRLDPLDPIRYDFSLCHLGMTGQCRSSAHGRTASCPLRQWCGRRPRTRPASRRPSARP